MFQNFGYYKNVIAFTGKKLLCNFFYAIIHTWIIGKRMNETKTIHQVGGLFLQEEVYGQARPKSTGVYSYF